MLILASSVCGLFKWRQFEPEVILLAVGWYLRFSLSYRDVEELLAERGLHSDHVTVWRWVQRYAPEMERRLQGTASAAGSMAVSPATDSAVRADSEVEVFLVGEIMAASVIAVSVGAVAAFVIVVFATLMGASSALDIRTITRFITPTITRTLFTGVILDTKVPPNCSLVLYVHLGSL